MAHRGFHTACRAWSIGALVALYSWPCAAQQQGLAVPPALQIGSVLNTRVLFEPRIAHNSALPLDEHSAAVLPTRSRLTLEFAPSKPSRRPANLLRVQLSGDAVLNLRPRSGGLAVNYQARF
jgi:hypothetical protein